MDAARSGAKGPKSGADAATTASGRGRPERPIEELVADQVRQFAAATANGAHVGGLFGPRRLAAALVGRP
eukprot:1040439-Alexandrium_andersonii.AAC.1